MITLKITAQQLETIYNWYGEKYGDTTPVEWNEEFIFEKYELNIDKPGDRCWMKVDKKTKIVSISLEHNGIRKFTFRFGIDHLEEGKLILSEVCEGPLFDGILSNETISSDEAVKVLQNAVAFHLGMVYVIETYIMSKQKDRQVKYVEVDEHEVKTHNSNGKKRKHIKKREDKPVVINFDDIVSGRIMQGRTHEIRCAKWPVRGHYRHYKNGRVVFIKAFEKGRDRNKGKNVDKTYVI